MRSRLLYFFLEKTVDLIVFLWEKTLDLILYLWNWFLKLSKKSKFVVVILLLIITIPSFQEEDSLDLVSQQETTTTTQLQETTTTTQLQETINTQCIDWDKATKSNNLKMAQLLETYVDQTENYINNEISFEKYLSILDELINESGELLDLQRETIPNKENEVADGWVQGAFAAYNQGFYSYKTGQEENDVFWINEGNDNLDFGTFSINEYYNTIEDC